MNDDSTENEAPCRRVSVVNSSWTDRCRALLPPFLRRYWDRVESSPVGARLARGAFWSLMGAVISRGLGLVASILVARMLGKVGFGELGMIQSTVGMFGTFAGFGLGLTATKYVAEFREKDPAKAGRILTLSGIVAWVTGGVASVALAIAAPWLAEHTLAAPHLANELRIGCLLVLLGAVNGAQTGALAGFEAFKRIAVVSLWAGLANFPCLVIGCWFWGLEGAVWGLVAALGVNCILNRLAMRHESGRLRLLLWAADWHREIPILWSFSLPSFLIGFLIVPAYWVCNVIIVNQPSGYGEMGIYNAAVNWRNAVLFIPNTASSCLLPVMANMHATSERGRMGGVFRLSIALSFFACLIPLIPTVYFSEEIMLGYGASFAGNFGAFAAATAVALPMAVISVAWQFCVSCGRTNWVLAAVLVWSAIVIGLTWLLRGEGAYGIAMAVLLSHLFHLLNMFLLFDLSPPESMFCS